MNILLLGSGGRESALAYKISRSPLCSALYIAPGNGGTGSYGTNVPDLKPMDFEAVQRFVKTNHIDLIVVGNEDPLVAGITDFMETNCPEVPVVGPRKAGAALEGSKDFAKDFMTRYGIPTAAYRSFTRDTVADGRKFLASLRPPYVLKADGLAAGKGVLIVPTLEEAEKALDDMLGGMFGHSGDVVVIEQFLSGIECSVFVLTDGQGNYRILPVAKDYKRIGEGDTGPNTGGMGAVSPVPFADEQFMLKVKERIIEPTLRGLIADGIDYRGFIFLGLINVDGDPMVIEYNVRMGDPETEVVMLRIASDLVPALTAAAKGDLGNVELTEDPRTAVTVMAVSEGYPGSYAKGYEITGLDAIGPDTIPFHAGTARDAEGKITTAGGRVIAFSSLGENIPEALQHSYNALDQVFFQGKTYRRDIGQDLMR